MHGENDELIKPVYDLMPFRILISQSDNVFNGSDSAKTLSFWTQIFYRNSIQNNMKFLMLQGRKSSKNIE
jgi:hypothetical protein